MGVGRLCASFEEKLAKNKLILMRAGQLLTLNLVPIYNLQIKKIFPPNYLIMFSKKKWLLRLHLIFETNLDDPSLNNGELAKRLQISKRHLFRKVNELTGMSPQKYQFKVFFKKSPYEILKEEGWR